MPGYASPVSSLETADVRIIDGERTADAGEFCSPCVSPRNRRVRDDIISLLNALLNLILSQTAVTNETDHKNMLD